MKQKDRFWVALFQSGFLGVTGLRELCAVFFFRKRATIALGLDSFSEPSLKKLAKGVSPEHANAPQILVFYGVCGQLESSKCCQTCVLVFRNSDTQRLQAWRFSHALCGLRL